MIKRILIIISIGYMHLYLYSCGSSRSHRDYTVDREGYKVDNIKRKNDWYIIYASKKDSVYKIVTRRKKSYFQLKKIKEGNYYKFILHSRRDNAPVIDGVKISPVNYLDIQCYSYDEKTEICIEPKKNIYDLYFAENLEGLCIVDK